MTLSHPWAYPQQLPTTPYQLPNYQLPNYQLPPTIYQLNDRTNVRNLSIAVRRQSAGTVNAIRMKLS